MKLSMIGQSVLAGALTLSAATLVAQGYPQPLQGSYPQPQGNYPQQGQPPYGDRDHDRDRDRGGWDNPPEDLRSDA